MFPLFVKVIGVKLPAPGVVNPVILGVLAEPTHAKEMPRLFGVQETREEFAPEHIDWESGLFVIVGVGLTVTVNEAGVPGQLLKVGVTVILPTRVPGALLLVLDGAFQGDN